MKIQNVKGGYDFLPEEQKIRNYINKVLEETFREFGFDSIETPILCYLDMLIDKYDENNDLLNEIYKLTDQGKRSLGLRYDLTVPFAKFIALNKNNIRMPFKRYEIAKVFRDGPVKVGRDREFTQCDADVVGLSGQFIEAELLSLYMSAFKKLNIDIIIKFNSRNLMKGLIKESGVKEEDISKVITIIDKMDKITKEELRSYLYTILNDNNKIDKLLDIFQMDIQTIKEVYKNTDNKDLIQGIEETLSLINYIEKLGFTDTCIFDITLARGQDYYTGNVFEVYDKSGYLKSSIGGGGRYDKMITEYISDNEHYPAVGISFGLTSIYEILKMRESFKNKSSIEFYIIPMDTPIDSLSLANKLRSFGYNVLIEMKKRKLKKSLDFANHENIPYVIILGEDEITSKKITIKDMLNQERFEINLENLEKIKEIVKLH